MMSAKEILLSYVAKAEKVIIELSFNEENGLKLLSEFKEELGKPHKVTEEEKEMFEACVYNALATINTAPNQTAKNSQLLSAITDAKEEIAVIAEIL